MIRYPVTSLFSVAMTLLAVGGHAWAEPFLSVDFRPTTAPTPQAGFQALTVASAGSGQPNPTTPYQTSEGEVVVEIVGASPFFQNGLFERPGVTNEGALTYATLYNAFVFNNQSGNSGTLAMTLTLSGAGIDANTDYLLRFWSYDSGAGQGSHTVTFSGTAGSLGSAGPLLWTGGVDPTTNNQYSTSGQFRSNSTGRLTINMSDSWTGATAVGDDGASGIRINAFTIAVVPEPSSIVMVGVTGVGLAGFGYYRARRKK